MPLEFDPIEVTPGQVKRVKLFTLDDVDYFVPAEMPGSYTVDMLDMIADGVGEAQAVAVTVRRILGDGWEALRSAEDVPPDQFGKIWDVVERMVLAASEDTVGKRRPVPRR